MRGHGIFGHGEEIPGERHRYLTEFGGAAVYAHEHPPLEEISLPSRWPLRTYLTFDGPPVVEYRGILWDFASAAVDAFTKAVISTAASQRAPLGERGVIPHREDCCLMVTGTTHGSFGFEIEEVQPQESMFSAKSAVELAIEEIKDVLESFSQSEDDTAEAVSGADTRALDDLRDFLRVVADRSAVCSLSFRDSVFRFADTTHVRRGLDRIAQDNLREGQEEIEGHFQEFLPQGRRAEFVTSAGEVISCRVAHQVSGAESINSLLNTPVTISTSYREVGKSRSRHTITGFSPS